MECPICSVVCRDGFSLQEHVELHLDHGAAGNCAGWWISSLLHHSLSSRYCILSLHYSLDLILTQLMSS